LFFLSLYVYSYSPLFPSDTIYAHDTLAIEAKHSIKIVHSTDSIYTSDSPTSPVESITQIIPDSIGKKQRVPSPQRATILSAVLPGLGQAYNHKYWKIPIIYSVGAGLYYVYNFQNTIFLKYKQKYENEVSKGSGADHFLIDSYTSYFEVARKRRDYCVIFMGVLYIANIVDAMADAHFLEYDISDDLSVQLKPNLMPEPYITSGSFSYGLCLNIHF
jgi:hypothetical protein